MLAIWEYAYIAGFFDGEGCIYAHPEATYLQIEIAQVDRRPLDFVQERYEGRIRLNKTNGRPIYKWMCPAKTSEKFLMDLLPFLIVKKEQAILALEFRKLRLLHNSRWNHNHEENEIIKIKRVELCTRISGLKHVGIA